MFSNSDSLSSMKSFEGGRWSDTNTLSLSQPNIHVNIYAAVAVLSKKTSFIQTQWSTRCKRGHRPHPHNVSCSLLWDSFSGADTCGRAHTVTGFSVGPTLCLYLSRDFLPRDHTQAAADWSIQIQHLQPNDRRLLAGHRNTEVHVCVRGVFTPIRKPFTMNCVFADQLWHAAIFVSYSGGFIVTGVITSSLSFWCQADTSGFLLVSLFLISFTFWTLTSRLCVTASHCPFGLSDFLLRRDWFMYLTSSLLSTLQLNSLQAACSMHEPGVHM